MADRKIHAGDDINSGKLDWRAEKHVASAYTGGTANNHGDHNGTGDPYTIFIITGAVIIRRMFGICNIDIVGAGSIDIGVIADINRLATQIADATVWDINEIWGMTDAPGTTTSSSPTQEVMHKGFNLYNTSIIETLAAADLTAGQVDWYVEWAAREPGGLLVPAIAVV